MNCSAFAKSLIDLISSFSATIPSQHAYKLIKISLEPPNITFQKYGEKKKQEHDHLGELLSKVNLIWQLWPIRLRQNAHTLILFLSGFHRAQQGPNK